MGSSVLFFFKQKTAYEMRISDWSSDVCSSDLPDRFATGSKLGLLLIEFRFHQAVEVDDDIFHLGIIHRSLGIGAPGVERARIIGEKADHVDRWKVDEFQAPRILDAAAEDEMKLAHGYLERGSWARLTRSLLEARVSRASP